MISPCSVYLFLVFAINLAMGAAVQAQEKSIGVIMPHGVAYYDVMHRASVEELKRLGYGPDKVAILAPKATSDDIAWMNLARKFEVSEVDAIVTYGAPSTMVAMKTASRTPIVFAGVSEPLSGKNVTGIRITTHIEGLIKCLANIKPFSRLGVLYASKDKDSVAQLAAAKALESRFGFKAVELDVSNSCEAIDPSKVEAFLFTANHLAMGCVDQAMEAALRNKISSGAVLSGIEEKGIIVTLSDDPQLQGKELAKTLVEIVTGKKPSAIPVKCPGNTEVILNLRAAKALNMSIPFDLLSMRTRVVK